MYIRALGLLLFSFVSLSAETRLTKSYGDLPLAFEDRSGSYVARGPDYAVSISPVETVFNLKRSKLTLRLIGANHRRAVTAVDRLQGIASYFRGANLRQSFALYNSVRMQDVYPGIDMVFHGNQQRLEYDFDVARGRDTSVISLAFDGADNIRIDATGDLILDAGGEEIRQPKPDAWQILEGRKVTVGVSYRLDSARHVTFVTGPHDANEALVIDPQVDFNNVFGGSQTTSAAAVALDPQGNIYTAGTTSSLDFPTLNPLQSQNKSTSGTAFVAKWTPDGSQLLYSTYLGGSGSDTATSLAVDSAGNAYVAGVTGSPNFPVTAGAIQTKLVGMSNAFIAKLAPNGSQLIYSTFLGGGSENRFIGIAVDSGGNAVVTGETSSAGFPVTQNAFQSVPVPGCTLGFILPVGVPPTGDAFISRLASDGGSLRFSTLLGGSCGTIGQAIAIDAGGNTWVAGATASPDFPVTPNALQPQFGGGYVDGFMAEFNPEGALAYASYLGGDGYDSISGIALDRAGNIYLSGVGALSQPASPGAVQPGYSLGCYELGIGPVQIIDNGVVFVARLTPNGESLSGLTYLGGGCVSNAFVAVDSSGAPWIAGSLFSQGSPFPTASPFQIGIGSGFVSKISADFTQLLFSTYFNTINGIALDSDGLAYVAGLASSANTQSAYVAKIDPVAPPVSLDQVLPTVNLPPSNNGFSAIAPGEVLRLIGKNLGPAAVTPGIINSSGFVVTSVAGVQVTFGGVPAPLLSVSAGEIDCVAPFELTGQANTTVQVQYKAVPSNPVLMPVSGLALEVLAVLNEDFSLNSATNPANPGSIVSVYVAGAGQTVPPSLDGQVNQSPFAQSGPQFQVQYYIPPPNTPGIYANGTTQSLPITFAGAAPGLIAGILQVNFFAPPQSATVTLQSGNSSNQFTVAIQ